MKTAFNKIKYLKLPSLNDNSDSALQTDALGRLQFFSDVLRQRILMNQNSRRFIFYIRSGHVKISFEIVGYAP